MQRSMTLLVVLAMLLVGCTTTAPDTTPTTAPAPTSTSPGDTASTPPPGRVAVVVAPAPSADAASAEAGSRRLAGRLDGAELRVVTADDPSFIVDLASLFATEGYDLVCVVGAGAEQAVREVAPTAPSTRFCASPARAQDMPPNVLPIDLRVQELGYVAGVALGVDGSEGAAAFVTTPTTWAPARVAAGMTAGLAAGGVASPQVRTMGPLRDGDEVPEVVPGVLGDGVAGILSLAGELDEAVRDVVAEVPVTVPGPTETPATEAADAVPSPAPTPAGLAGLVAGPDVRPEDEDAELVEPVLAILEVHLAAAVEVAIERHVGGWDASPVSVGLAEGAFRVDVGTSDRAGAVTAAVEDAVTAIREGQLEVPVE